MGLYVFQKTLVHGFAGCAERKTDRPPRRSRTWYPTLWGGALLCMAATSTVWQQILQQNGKLAVSYWGACRFQAVSVHDPPAAMPPARVWLRLLC